MRNSGLLFLGLLLILFGVLALVSEVLEVNFWTICWPIGLILIGLWMLVRPRLMPPGTHLDMRLLGDVKRRGTWQVHDEEFWSLVGDTKLDFSEADIPPGETRLRIYGLVGDIRLRLPQGVGLCLYSTAFLSETRIQGNKQDTFISPFEYTSLDYENAERKIRLDCWFFVTNIKVEQIET